MSHLEAVVYRFSNDFSFLFWIQIEGVVKDNMKHTLEANFKPGIGQVRSVTRALYEI